MGSACMDRKESCYGAAPHSARDWADWYTQELCASFPACECKPLEAIRALAAEGRYEPVGPHDGAALLATPWST